MSCCLIFSVAHDLDIDDRALMEAGRLSFVLYHDLSVDLENVFHAFLHYHKLTKGLLIAEISNVQVVAPENIPTKRNLK
jgi:LacI family transcriptional regulator